MVSRRIAVIGAGIAGLTASVDLARQGFEVLLFERAATPGGKMRQVAVGTQMLDAGPTVFTLKEVFEELYADAGERFEHSVRLNPAHLLARHVWSGGQQLDLFADLERTTAAIASFAGPGDAQGFTRFAAQSERVFATLKNAFIKNSRPSPLGLSARIGFGRLPDLWSIQPFATLWNSTAKYFRDPRLRQLFARYATYCGSSPFAAPATLMLIAHVERSGVWYVEGGMHRLAQELAALAQRNGAQLRYSSEISRIHLQRGRVSAIETARGERLDVDAVVCNADNNALASGLFGTHLRHGVRATTPTHRSLSAMTWNAVARPRGVDLAHHTVFFCDDYQAEFDAIFRRNTMPTTPTVYVCAQDRTDDQGSEQSAERLLYLINAPAIGDTHSFNSAEIDACAARVTQTFTRCGLTLEMAGPPVVTTPTDFNRLFPATGGALYGPASHGWMASFTRPPSRSKIPGLYLAGGSTHPGPGVPMAAMSGRLAAACIVADSASMQTLHPAATSGGTSMH